METPSWHFPNFKRLFSEKNSKLFVEPSKPHRAIVRVALCFCLHRVFECVRNTRVPAVRSFFGLRGTS